MRVEYSRYEHGQEADWYAMDETFQAYLHRFLPKDVLDYGRSRLEWLGTYAPMVMDVRATYTDRDGQPKLNRYNRQGQEISEVSCNEGYWQTVRDVYQSGIVGLRYAKDLPVSIPFFYQFAMGYLVAQSESGFYCPVTLTASCALVLEQFAGPGLRDQYLPRLTAMGEDIQQLLQGATWLTEITGGSDVGSTQTTARANVDGSYALSGEKWFASNADAGIAVTLAKMPDGGDGTRGLGLFLVPRELPNGQRNQIEIRRLKDKLGVRAVPSGEVLLNGAAGWLIGDADKGFRYMAEALNLSRIFTAVGTLGISRRAFLEAAIYTNRRVAFGQQIANYPMVRTSLIDLMVDLEAGWALVAQTLRHYDAVYTYESTDKRDKILYRLLVSFAKHRCSERAVQGAKTALELHGGNGYIEDWVTPRLLRDAQVNTVWEGTANIMSLDLLRLIQKEEAHLVFAQDVTCTLDSLSEPTLQPLVSQVRQELKGSLDAIAALTQEDARTQSAHAKQLLDYLVDIFEATYLLDHAAYQFTTTDNARGIAVAKWYIEQRLLRGRGFSPLTMSTAANRGLFNHSVTRGELYESIVHYTPLALEQALV